MWSLWLSMWGCASDGSGNKGDVATSAPVEECADAVRGCSPSEADEGVTAASWALADEVMARFEAGERAGTIRAWLETRDDLVGVSGDGDDVSLNFRLRGGAWTGVIGPDGARPSDGEQRAALADQTVVQTGTPYKRALLLSPFHSTFKNDDVPVAEAGLQATPDYEGGVYVHLDGQMRSSELLSWGSYGLVHFSTHGMPLCFEGDFCITVLTIDADEELPLAIDPVNNVLLPGGRRGHGIELSEILSVAGDLSQTAIFASACSSYQHIDFEPYLGGASYLGWDNTVSDSGAKAAAEAFYHETLVNGRTVVNAHGELNYRGLDSVTSRAPSGKEVTANLLLHGGDHYLREVVELVDEQDQRLKDGDRATLIGSIGDGEPDALKVRARVLGVEPGDEALYQVQVNVDGHDALFPLTLVEHGTKESEYIWIVEGEVELGVDVEDLETHSLQVRIDDIVTSHLVDVELEGPRLVLESTIDLIGYDVSIHQVVHGEAPLNRGPDGVYTGSGLLTYLEYESFIVPECRQTNTLVDGQLHVTSVIVPGDDIESGLVPTQVSILPSAPLATNHIMCPDVSFELADPYFNSGALPPMMVYAPFDPTLGIILRPGDPGTEDDVVATWNFVTDISDDNGSFTVVTELTLFAK